MSSRSIPRALFDRAFLSYNLLFFFVFSHLAFFYLYPLFLEAENASKTKIGIIMGLFPAGTVLFRPLMGWLVERTGEKKVLVGGVFLILASGFLYLVITNIGPPLYFLRLLHGIGFSAFIASSFTGISWRIPPERRGEAFGFIGAVILFAVATMPLTGEYFIRWSGFKMLFIVALGFAVCALLISFFLMPREGKIIRTPPKNSFKQVLKKKSFVAVLIITIFFVQGQATVLNFIALMTESLGTSAGRFLGAAATVAILCRLFVAKTIDRYDKKKFLIVSFFVFGSGLVLIPHSNSVVLFMASTVLYGTGMGFLYPLLNVLAVDQASASEMPAVMSIYTGVFDAGFISGAVLSGWLADLLSLPAIFYFGALVGVLGAILAIALPLGTERRLQMD